MCEENIAGEEMQLLKQVMQRANKEHLLVEVMYWAMLSLISGKGNTTVQQALADGLDEWDC